MSAASNPAGTRGVLLDAMGTVLRLVPPVPALARALAAAGHPSPEDRVAAAVRGEIAYYRAHHLEGRTPAAVLGLRRACAAVLAEGLDSAPPLDCLTAFAISPAVLTSRVPRLTLKAMRNFLAPMTVAPAERCSLGSPMSGCLSGRTISVLSTSNCPLRITSSALLSGRRAASS